MYFTESTKTQSDSIKVQHREAKMKNCKRVKRKPNNREVFNLLMSNPFLTQKERDHQIREHCGFLIPRSINF